VTESFKLTLQPKWEDTSPIRAVRNPIHKMDVQKHTYPWATSTHESPLPRKRRICYLYHVLKTQTYQNGANSVHENEYLTFLKSVQDFKKQDKCRAVYKINYQVRCWNNTSNIMIREEKRSLLMAASIKIKAYNSWHYDSQQGSTGYFYVRFFHGVWNIWLLLQVKYLVCFQNK